MIADPHSRWRDRPYSRSRAGTAHRYVILDVFTDTPLQGNPLGVFCAGERVDPALMQPLARELNLSETVFLTGLGDAGRGGQPAGRGASTAGRCADARVRIFTPRLELPFAGHPVLGTAFIVGEQTGLEVVRLATGAGIVPVTLTRDDDGRVRLGEMSQPLPTVKPFPAPDRLLAALGVRGSALPIELYDNGVCHAYVVVDGSDTVATLAPDMGALAALGAFGVSCVAVEQNAGVRVRRGAGAQRAALRKSHGEGQTRVRSRMFAPGLGVAEDPATGSAAGPLAVHLARHGLIDFGEQIVIEQGVELGRRSLLYARALGAVEHVEQVLVAGSAVVVADGVFTL